MICAGCGSVDVSARDPCSGCGLVLDKVCPNCGAYSPRGARFCARCGTRFARAGGWTLGHADGRGERRQVTLLFCDLVGSTALASRLDPEEVRAHLRAYQDACAAAISFYDGHIAQTLGDGLLVYFGYPHAHEDDAERSVRAGLAIVRAVRDIGAKRGAATCAVRVGIQTGLVVVGHVAHSDTRANMAVVGDTPNLAARLQELARPNQVLIGAATQRLVADRFELAALPPQRVKGIEHPLNVFEVLRAVDTGIWVLARFRRGVAPLVGRDDHLQRLERCFAAACSGAGNCAIVSGPPGIGKSRLLQALVERVRGARPLVLQLQCSPYFRNTAFYPLVTQLEHEAGIERGDVSARKLRKLRALLRANGHVCGDHALIAQLMWGPLQTTERPALGSRRQFDDMLAALIAAMVSLSRRAPLLVIIDDAHWIDPSSLRLLAQILERIAGSRVLIVIGHRESFSLPFRHHPSVSEVGLDRLGRVDCHSIVRFLAADNVSVTRRTSSEIVERSDGIPFFVEELTRAALEAEGSGGGGVPVSLQESLTARLDRIGPLKLVAQLGACIGRTFSYALLAAVSELDADALRNGLERLCAAELLSQSGELPGARFTFRHALVQNAAYEALLLSERRRIHAAIARNLERQDPRTCEATPEILAQHLAAAGEHAAACEQWLRAGMLAQRRSAHVEAIAHLRAGLRSLRELPSSRAATTREIELQSALARSYMAGEGWAGQHVHGAYARARGLCRELGDTRKECQVMWGLWAHHAVRAELTEARARADEYVKLAEAEADRSALLMADSAALIAYFCLGEFATAQRHADRIHRLYRRDEDRDLVHVFNHDPEVMAYMFEGNWLWLQGFSERAELASRLAVERARTLQHPFMLSYALMTGSAAYIWRREHDHLITRVDEGLRLAAHYRIPLFQVFGPFWAAPALIEREESAGLVAALQRCLASMHASEARLHLPFYLLQVACALEADGQLDAGCALLDQALDRVNATYERWIEPELHRVKARLLRALGDTARAEDSLRSGLGSALRMGARGFELRLAADLAELHTLPSQSPARARSAAR